jgi:hypothetical protein
LKRGLHASLYGLHVPGEQLDAAAPDRDPRTFLTGPDLPMPRSEHDYCGGRSPTGQEQAFGTLDRATLKLLDGLARRGAPAGANVNLKIGTAPVTVQLDTSTRGAHAA